MLLEACAKINWTLDITGVREDGYHLMDMLMQPISLADTVRLSLQEDLTLETSGHPLLRADESHLAMRAARLLKEATGYPGGAALSVHKRIPVGAGLGGGSADAAAVLTGLNQLWQTGLTPSELEALGLRLGADIPFCLRGGLCRARGIGEELEVLGDGPVFPLIVVQPCRGLSTRGVFKFWREQPDVRHPDTDLAARALQEGQLAPLRQALGNVLQPISARLRPPVSHAVRRLLDSGADAALMTGSGSAVFGVFRSPSRARAAFSRVSALWRSAFLCHTQRESCRICESASTDSATERRN